MLHVCVLGLLNKCKSDDYVKKLGGRLDDLTFLLPQLAPGTTFQERLAASSGTSWTI